MLAELLPSRCNADSLLDGLSLSEAILADFLSDRDLTTLNGDVEEVSGDSDCVCHVIIFARNRGECNAC